MQLPRGAPLRNPIPYAAPPLPVQRPVARTQSKFLRRALLTLLAVLFALAVARTFVGDIYRVESTSMEPTIRGSPEYVFVRYGRDFTPQRFDVVVFAPAARESGAVVKRVGALPGESALISGGDLLIEGHRLGVAVQRPLPVAIFDSALEPIEVAFSLPGVALERGHGGWKLNAQGRREDLNFNRRARDDRFDENGKLIFGSVEVNDLRIEGRFAFEHSGKCTLRLTEEGDGFELELTLVDGVIERARILRRAGTAELAVIATLERPGPAKPGELCRVSFENIDNILIAEVCGRTISGTYESNTPLPGVVEENYRHLQPRVGLAVAELGLRIERLAVLRDLYYTTKGALGTGSPVALGPDEIFVLGDNSADSDDSRVFGPVRLEELAGRATRVVWPLAAVRSLGQLRLLTAL